MPVSEFTQWRPLGVFLYSQLGVLGGSGGYNLLIPLFVPPYMAV
jgi:hypothetical protein